MSEQEVPQAAPPSAPEQAPAQPEPKKSAIGRILGLIIVVAVIAGAGLAYKYLSGAPVAKVGDCITQTVKQDASDAKVVDCDKPEAKNKVVGIVENVTEADMADQDKAQLICEKFPTWENVVWYGKKNGKGDAWCLEPIK